eukprot:scaffold34700_cov256-Amphora_coffeaeformis.AAC.2
MMMRIWMLLGTSGLVLLVGTWWATTKKEGPAVPAKWARRRLQSDQSPTWQGLPLTHHHHHELFPTSSVHCVGENFNQSTAWEYRSCQFTNLCFDTKQKIFVAIRSTQEAKLYEFYTKTAATISTSTTGDWQSTVTISTLLSLAHSAMSLGTIVAPASGAGARERTSREATNSPWFPTVMDQSQAQEQYSGDGGYYEIPDNYVWIPWQPTSSSRHWLWTNWWPLFVAASLFPQTSSLQLLPVIVPPSTSLESQSHASSTLLLHVPTEFQQHWAHPLTVDENDDTGMLSPRLICARHAVAGMGRYMPTLGETDSIGHGPALQAFARHVRATLQVSHDHHDMSQNNKPGRVVGMVDGKVGTDLLRSKHVQAMLPHLEDISAQDVAQQTQALVRATFLITTLNDGCWAPLLVPDHTVVLPYRSKIHLFFQPSIPPPVLVSGSLCFRSVRRQTTKREAAPEKAVCFSGRGCGAKESSLLILTVQHNPCDAFQLKQPLRTLQQAVSTTFLSVLRDFRSTRTLPYQDDDDVFQQARQKSRISLTQLLQHQLLNNNFPKRIPKRTPPPASTEFVAETNLPTHLGMFRLRGYRLQPSHPVLEPCVIYAADKPPTLGGKHVPVRVHDQCLTSEVFGSLRYVYM